MAQRVHAPPSPDPSPQPGGPWPGWQRGKYGRGVQLAVFSILVGVLSGFAGGGRFANVGWRRIRLLGVPVVGFAAVVTGRLISSDLAFYVGLAGLCCLAVFAIANVKALSCMWLVALGLSLNVGVTANNHGMPYSPVALATAGVRPASYNDIPKSTPMSHPERPGDQLLFLADIVPVQPLRTVVSFGDILVAFGLGCVTATAMWDRRPRRLRNPRHLKRAGTGSAPVKTGAKIRTAGSATPSPAGKRHVRFGSARIGFARPATVPVGVGVESSPDPVAGSPHGRVGVISRVRAARRSGIAITPSELAAQRQTGMLVNGVGGDSSNDRSAVETPLVAEHQTDQRSNGDRSDASFARPGSPASFISGGLKPDADIRTPGSGSDPRMAARLRLLEMTGDASVLIDLTDGLATNFEDVAAAHAVGAALRRHALDEHLVKRASWVDSSSESAVENERS